MITHPPGVLLVAKPVGPTSHDVVEQVRRGLGVKAGHAGTLDPFASGLLLVTVERATRYQDALTRLGKAYDATAQFGVTSSTGDPEGELQPTGSSTSEARAREVLPAFVGEQRQRVPAYSAVKVAGERLHRRARRNEHVERPVREVRVDELRLIGFEANRARLRIRCSKGTYVRQLISDIGDELGCGAYCSSLARTQVGPFELADAASADEIADAETVTGLVAWQPLAVRIGEHRVEPAFAPDAAGAPARLSPAHLEVAP